jgi:hypothetical protein
VKITYLQLGDDDPLAVPLTRHGRIAWLRAMSPRPGDARHACGFSTTTVAAALAAAAGRRVTRSDVVRWEAGRQPPTGPAEMVYCRVVAGFLRHLAVDQDEDQDEDEAP